MIIPEVCGDEAISLSPGECDSCESFLRELARLSDLVDQIQALLPLKQDKLIAGKNIQLTSNGDGTVTISASALSRTYTFSYLKENGAWYSTLTDGESPLQKEPVPVEWYQTYTGTTPISVSGTTITHNNSGVTAGSYGPTANVNGSNGTKINVPQITVDAKGHVTSVTNREYTSVDSNTTYSGTAPISVSGTSISHNNSGVTAGTYGPSANVTGTNDTTISVPQITVDAKGHVTSVTNRTLTNKDSNTTYGASSPITLSGTTFGHANSGVAANTYGPSANVTGSNDTTIYVPQITVNATGHVTSVTNRTLTNKNTTYGNASASAAGLMSAAHFTKLNNINAWTTINENWTSGSLTITGANRRALVYFMVVFNDSGKQVEHFGADTTVGRPVLLSYYYDENHNGCVGITYSVVSGGYTLTLDTSWTRVKHGATVRSGWAAISKICVWTII